MFKYFFILGTNPTLSVAEISAVLGQPHKMQLLNAALVYSTDKPLEAEPLIRRLGGTVKIGEITADLASPNAEQVLKTAMGLVRPGEKKFYFGFSVYGGVYDIKPLAMEIKNHLREQGTVCRWVVSRELVLSSVVVEQNKLLNQGAEIVMIKNGGRWLIGRTLAVQPFKELSKRDYGRPARDDRSGMLPPKLAQIMINLALPQFEGDIGQCRLLDPFCGSGTVLTEALLMGYQNLIGSDISSQAIKDTQANITWLTKNLKSEILNLKLSAIDARRISQSIAAQSIDAIVTEPYLGPQRGRFDPLKTKKELEELYSRSLKEFKKILKPNGRIVMIWPVFRNQSLVNRSSLNVIRLSLNLNDLEIINPVPKNLLKNKIIQLTDRDTIVYGRPDQKIWREIVILEQE